MKSHFLMMLLLLPSATCSTSVLLTEVTTGMEELVNGTSWSATDLMPQKLESGNLEVKNVSLASMTGELIKATSEAPVVTSRSGEKMSTVQSVNDTASSIKSTTTGIDPSTAFPNVTSAAPKDKDPRVPINDHDSIKPSTIPAGELTPDSGVTATNHPKDGNETFTESKPTLYFSDVNTVAKVTPRASPGDKKGKGDQIKLGLISVIIIILFLLLLTIIFLIIRKKKRSGSFRTQSRKNQRQDVWAGQVPELGEGKAAQDPSVVENGKARPKTEVELTTFASSEKAVDTVSETSELAAEENTKANGGDNLVKKDAVQEKAPLLEEGSPDFQEPEDKKEEEFLIPPEEQELLGNGVKQ